MANIDSLLQKANTLKSEISELERNIEAGKQFRGNDMCEALMEMPESLLHDKTNKLSEILTEIESLSATEGGSCEKQLQAQVKNS